MKRLLPLLALLASTGCAAGSDIAGDGGQPVPVSVDLLVLPPVGVDGVPAQIISGLTQAELGDGSHDLHLSAGTEMTAHVRSADLIPIDGASVRFRMRGAAGYDVVETTGPSGDVTLDLGAGIYDVDVTPNETLYPELPPRFFHGVVVLAGSSTQEQTLQLDPGHRIRGTLLSDQGTTLQQWHVSARLEGDDDARSTSATTSMVGTFEIWVPSDGFWFLQMSPPSGAVGEPTATHRIEVTGDIEPYVFQFPPLTEHVVTGTVTGIGGLTTDFSNLTVRARAPQLLVDQPVAGVVISYSGSTTTDVNGFFSLNVRNGSGYTISIEPPAPYEYSHKVNDGIEITGDIALSAPQTELYPKVNVSGTAVDLVTLAGTDGARVWFTSDDSVTPYLFIDADGTDGNGQFDLTANVGTYTAEVLPAPGSGLVRTAQQVPVQAAITDLSLALTPGQVVHGKVFDPNGDAMELVTIIALDPDDSMPVGSDETLSESNGDWLLTVPILQ